MTVIQNNSKYSSGYIMIQCGITMGNFIGYSTMCSHKWWFKRLW